MGYLLNISDKTIYYAGDTDFIPEMKKLKDIYLAILPIGGTYTMDDEEATEATLEIEPEYVIPMHRFNQKPADFKREVESESEIKVLMLKSGEQFRTVL